MKEKSEKPERVPALLNNILSWTQPGKFGKSTDPKNSGPLIGKFEVNHGNYPDEVLDSALSRPRTQPTFSSV